MLVATVSSIDVLWYVVLGVAVLGYCVEGYRVHGYSVGVCGIWAAIRGDYM